MQYYFRVCLTMQIAKNDIAAIETFKNIFPNLKIIPIYAKPLIQEGGALHCVTWEYIEYNNHKYCE